MPLTIKFVNGGKRLLIGALHADVRAGWTVAELGHVALGLRRAVRRNARLCADRISGAMAQDALSRGGKSLDRLADEIGYESASAAFRRRIGCAPGAFARLRRTPTQPNHA
jgi:hypothetical protein